MVTLKIGPSRKISFSQMVTFADETRSPKETNQNEPKDHLVSFADRHTNFFILPVESKSSEI